MFSIAGYIPPISLTTRFSEVGGWPSLVPQPL